MKLIGWSQFSWNLKSLDGPAKPLGANYGIRKAARGESEAVRKVIFSAFSLDSDWSDSLNRVWPLIEQQTEAAFAPKEPHCLVLTHGVRIIGASTVSFAPDDVRQILSGPCVLVEYRNRGLGSALLLATLQLLAGEGLDRAVGVTKKNIPAAKFVYPKFGGTVEPVDLEVEVPRA